MRCCVDEVLWGWFTCSVGGWGAVWMSGFVGGWGVNIIINIIFFIIIMILLLCEVIVGWPCVVHRSSEPTPDWFCLVCGSKTVATVLLHSTQHSKPFLLYSVFVTGLWEQSWFYTLSLDCKNSHGFILCLCHWIVRTAVVLYSIFVTGLWEHQRLGSRVWDVDGVVPPSDCLAGGRVATVVWILWW